VYLCNRPDGQRRIEGYAVNLGKRIEGYSRQGLYSRIMLSQECHDILRGAVVKHTQLRQRIFFHRHMVPLELMKGVAQSQCVYELKFYHRLGITAPGDVYTQYDALFAVDRTNSWAYYQLFDYCAYNLKDWDRAFALAKTAHVANPLDEKVLLDLAKCYLHFGRLRQSANLAEQALQLNDQFDLAHEHLMEIAAKEEDIDAQIALCRNMVRLSPDSPVNNLNLGLTLLTAGRQEEGLYHVLEALRVFPEYPTWPAFAEALRQLDSQGKLPAQLAIYVAKDLAAG
jgi:tetratricopeptide (TPR) repeat protein